MTKPKRPAPPPPAPPGPNYTIDELAAHTGVPSRTIRYYQSKGALPKPEIRGRVAYYDDAHVERLDLIAQLQDRGLSIRAIRDLVQQIDQGQIDLNEWLGLGDELQKPWLDDQAKLYGEAELYEVAGSGRKALIGDLLRHGLVRREGDQFLVPSPRMLQIALDFERAGISLDTSTRGGEIIRKHMEPMARELVKLYIDRLGDELSDENLPQNVAAALESLRPLGQEAVLIAFSRAVQQLLREIVETGKATELSGRKRRSRSD